MKDEIGDDISDSDSDSCSTRDDDDKYSAGETKNSLIKTIHDDDAHMDENYNGNNIATEFMSNVVTISGT